MIDIRNTSNKLGKRPPFMISLPKTLARSIRDQSDILATLRLPLSVMKESIMADHTWKASEEHVCNSNKTKRSLLAHNERSISGIPATLPPYV